MSFLDFISAPGKKQANIKAYSPEHRAIVKELARRGSEW